MPGNQPPESCWYTIERIEHWMELFDIQEGEIALLYGPRLNHSGNIIMDIYGKYQGDKNMDTTWDAQIDYSNVQMDIDDWKNEYELWQDTLQTHFNEAQHYPSKTLNQKL